jgi:hypothetical protein
MSTNAVPAQRVPSIFDRIAESVAGRDGLVAGDARADNRRRSVLLSRDRVTIDRSYRGIAMRLSVPVSAYQGVCVAVKPAATGGFVYELRLAHRDPDLSVTLAEALDEGRIWADWRVSAGYFNLPALVERNDEPEPWVAELGAGQRHDRRAKRRHRPGIVTRRAVRLEALETVHRENEIIARD